MTPTASLSFTYKLARSLVPGRRGRRRRPAGRRRFRRLQGRQGPASRKPKPRRAKASPASSPSIPARWPIINAAFTPSEGRDRARRGDRRRIRGTARRRRACRSAAKWSIARTSCRPSAYWSDHDRRLTWPRLQNRNPRTQSHHQPTTAKGWGTDAPDQPLRPMEFERRALRPDDVAIKITFAGFATATFTPAATTGAAPATR